jgi:hypothetical protein
LASNSGNSGVAVSVKFPKLKFTVPFANP